MSMDNILGDPFALATISIAMLAWLIAFIGSILATASHPPNDGFPNYSWFTIAYMLCCILGIFVVIASNTTQTYHVAIVGFLATGLVLTSSIRQFIDLFVEWGERSNRSGHILLSMVNIVWIFYFGSTPSAVPRAYLDSFALHKDHRTSSGRGMSTAYGNGYGSGRPDTSISSNVPPQSGFPGGAIGAERNSSQPRFGAKVVQPTEYPYRAKAIYSYDANPDDANEISFAKHEILEVSDDHWGRYAENTNIQNTPSLTGLGIGNYIQGVGAGLVFSRDKRNNWSVIMGFRGFGFGVYVIKTMCYDWDFFHSGLALLSLAFKLLHFEKAMPMQRIQKRMGLEAREYLTG
ncbi:hypothetical protein DID88_007339 [Monilinia fructigena]|uniref:Uncharacterized protein n=1 Tax=Monilinia fructigena TaxID=38457 RepID=A0A395J8R5_9HELO|nr:hypothetical protein DID88_007339 [Monilinia fructigena]